LFYADSMSDEKTKKTHQIGMRISEEDWQRIDAMVRRAKSKNKGRIFETDVIRELMGLDPPNLLSEMELARFRKEALAAKADGP
jgi:hypothetical protein